MILSEVITTIRDWVNLGDEVYPDSVVTSWVRMAEEYLSEKLRCKHMVQFDEALLVSDRVALPSDWLQLELVRFPDGKPLIYSPRGEFYDSDLDNENRYTIVGNFIMVNPINAVDGSKIEIAYYQAIPPLTEDGPTWLFDYYPRLGIVTVLLQAGLYAIEDARTPMWESQITDMVQTINDRHVESRTRGSKLVARHKSSWRHNNAKSRSDW